MTGEMFYESLAISDVLKLIANQHLQPASSMRYPTIGPAASLRNLLIAFASCAAWNQPEQMVPAHKTAVRDPKKMVHYHSSAICTYRQDTIIGENFSPLH